MRMFVKWTNLIICSQLTECIGRLRSVLRSMDTLYSGCSDLGYFVQQLFIGRFRRGVTPRIEDQLTVRVEGQESFDVALVGGHVVSQGLYFRLGEGIWSSVGLIAGINARSLDIS